MEELHTAIPTVAEQNSTPLTSGRLPYTSPVTLAADTEPALFICQSVRDSVKFQSSIQVNPLQEIIDEPDDFTFDDFGN